VNTKEKIGVFFVSFLKIKNEKIKNKKHNQKRESKKQNARQRILRDLKI